MQTPTAAKQVIENGRRRSVKARGFSLIEVLVAIAILSVGILAILILFPAGVSSLQTAAEFSDANRLGQAELARADASQIQLIAGIYPNNFTMSNVNPATLLTTGPDNTTPVTQNSDVDAYRFIQGETLRVPAPVIDVNDQNSNPVSLYTVVANPISVASNTPLAVYGVPWEGVSGDLSGSLTDPNASSASDLVAGQPQYLIDYTLGEILLAPEDVPSNYSPYPEEIQFTVTGSDGKVYTQLLTISTMQAQAGMPLLLSSITVTTGTGNGLEPPIPWVVGSDKLSRNFHQVGSGTYAYSNFDGDPYEYQLYSPPDVTPALSFGSTNDPASLGVLAFNPLGAQIHGINGAPLEAVLNYYTYDWHIISEDRSVTSPQGAIKLSLTSLLSATAGDKLSDTTTPFTGLFTYSGAAAGASNPDIMVLDLDKGNLLIEGTDYRVSYPNGTVTFINPNGTYTNDHLRIFYHPAKDWGVALSRAPMIYTYDSTANTTPALAHFSLSTDGTTMYFPLADVGKQVDLRYTFTESGSTTSTTTENLFTISSPDGYGEVALTDGSGNPLPSGTTISTASGPTVKGVSVSAIVIWKENGIWRSQTSTAILPSRVVPASTTLQ